MFLLPTPEIHISVHAQISISQGAQYREANRVKILILKANMYEARQFMILSSKKKFVHPKNFIKATAVSNLLFSLLFGAKQLSGSL